MLNLSKAAINLQILRRMIDALPEPTKTLLSIRLEALIDDISEQSTTFCQTIAKEMEDIHVLTAAMEFDLVSTKQERDKYKSMLGE